MPQPKGDFQAGLDRPLRRMLRVKPWRCVVAAISYRRIPASDLGRVPGPTKRQRSASSVRRGCGRYMPSSQAVRPSLLHVVLAPQPGDAVFNLSYSHYGAKQQAECLSSTPRAQAARAWTAHRPG